MENNKTNLSASYDNYKMNFDEDAWTHFQQLKNEKKQPKRTFNIRSLRKFGLLLLLLLGAVAIFYFKRSSQSKVNVTSDTYSPQNESVNVDGQAEQKNETAMTESTKAIDANTFVSQQTSHVVASNIAVNDLKDGKTNATKTAYQNASKDVDHNGFAVKSSTYAESVMDLPTVEHSSSIYTNEVKNKNKSSSYDGLSESNLADKRDEAKVLLSGIATLPYANRLIMSNVVRSVSPAFVKIDRPFLPMMRYNHIGLKLGYATFEVNGSIANGNDVEKHGIVYQLEYKRMLNNILGVGATVGMTDGEDVNNPQLDTLDYEKIAYAHVNAYLHLWNSLDHQLYIKAGGGITRTKRLHSSFSVDADGNKTRHIQRGTVQDIGFQLEGGYRYRIYNDFWLGVNAGIISGNDGAWYGGITLGMAF